MQFSFSAIAILLAFGVNLASADRHHDLVCVKKESNNNSHVHMPATRCACDHLKKVGKCDDCSVFEDHSCHSDGEKLDGDEFEHACTTICSEFDATGSSILP
ncbi:hypothetical protein PpBr36_00046 [Pyricularia pennisetigena]|uniref:hypothetical protein n=1 Tax=Pyricularia pennisetigena TaxID=1578925 RepID=UPI0011508633|nr:hypothetical protein PpBr36_00046 [Pyricularia pennisetigena]TLS29188.1 hypothetical protein PpBr36_00046 [Pyricularia pennisetigena]